MQVRPYAPPNPYLQPQGALEIIQSGLRLFRDNLAALVMVALVPHLVLLVVEYVVLIGGESGGPLMFLLVITVLMNGVALTALTLAICRAILGEEPSVADIYGRLMQVNTLGVIGVYIITAFIVSGGFMLLVVPGVIFGALLAPAVTILLVERKRLFPTLARSFELMRGEILRGVAVFAWFIVVAGLLPGLLVLAGSGMAMGPLSPLLGAVLGALTLPLGFAPSVLLYFSRRAQEGAAEGELAEAARTLVPAVEADDA